MKVWWMTINRAMGNSYLEIRYRKVIAQGWPHLGDLSIVVDNFAAYWQRDRQKFESLIQLLALPVYPEDAAEPPQALHNLYNLLSITKGDLVVAVESAQGAGQVMGISQAERNAWNSYRHANPDTFDYAHTVCFPVEWIDWESSIGTPPNPPAMIAGIQPMGAGQAERVQTVWNKYHSR